MWSKQLLVRFGELPSEPEDPRFDQKVAGKLDLSQIVWWDETHRKCLIGGISTNRNYSIKFKRNKDGRLDLKDGKFDEKQVQILNCKYEKECRLGLGCAMVTPKNPDGTFLPVTGKVG